VHAAALHRRDERVQQIDEDQGDDERREDDPDRVDDVAEEEEAQQDQPDQGPRHDPTAGRPQDERSVEHAAAFVAHGLRRL
jgi:hypothetical protein